MFILLDTFQIKKSQIMAGLKLFVMFILMCFLSRPASSLKCERHTPSDTVGDDPIVEIATCSENELCLRLDMEHTIPVFDCELQISYLLQNI